MKKAYNKRDGGPKTLVTPFLTETERVVILAHDEQEIPFNDIKRRISRDPKTVFRHQWNQNPQIMYKCPSPILKLSDRDLRYIVQIPDIYNKRSE